jgi:amino acid transporter
MVERGQAGARPLGFWSLLSLGLNGIIGVGIFFMPNQVAALVPGAAGAAMYALTALALIPVACVYATLGSRFPEDGGPYVWARAAFGPGLGFAVGWIAYVSALFSTAAIVAGLARHAAPGLGLAQVAGERLFGALAVLALAATAATGLRPSAIAWNVLTVLKLAPLVLLAGAFVASPAPPPERLWTAAAPSDFARAALVIVFALQGFEIVPVPAGHARAGSRAVPAATLLSLAGAAMLYVLLHAACVRSLPGLASEKAPLVAAGSVYGGGWLARLLVIGTNISALGIALAMFAMTPRYLAALGRADALGEWIGREDARGVPRAALAATTLGVVIFVLAGEIGELFVLSSVAVLAQYAVSTASLAVMGARRQYGVHLRQLWPVPLALAAILLVGRAASLLELFAAAVALAVGAALLALHRRKS